jgi:nucleotide-binding universal stress UspA family protein
VFERIVVATDLSPTCDEIIAHAAELRTFGCRRVILAYVITVKFLVGLDELLRVEAQPKLEAQARLLESLGLEVAIEMPLGIPGFRLNEVAHRHGASLIVLGPEGKSLLREVVVGSVSRAVLHYAQHPVLLINAGLVGGEGRNSCGLASDELLSHVLFPTDFSEVANMAFGYLRGMVPLGLARVTLLHTFVDFESRSGRATLTAHGCLKRLQARLIASGVPEVYTRLKTGHPTFEIQEALQTGNYSLVLMGTVGKSLVSETLLGGVAHNVAMLAPCPVLLIPRASWQVLERDEF